MSECQSRAVKPRLLSRGLEFLTIFTATRLSRATGDLGQSDPSCSPRPVGLADSFSGAAVPTRAERPFHSLLDFG